MAVRYKQAFGDSADGQRPPLQLIIVSQGVNTIAEFYLWPRDACYAITFIIALCFLAQTLTAVASFYRHPRSRSRIFEAVLELCVLLHVFAASLLHGQAMQGYDMGLFAPPGYGGLRVAAFIAVAVSAALVTIEIRDLRALPVIAAACFTLPIMERTGGLFAYLYVIATLFFLVRSVLTGWARYGEIRANLSALSIKNAMDSLNTGVMFCESGGFIVLCNERMQRLMSVLTGEIKRNGEQFIRLLLSGEIMPGCEIIWFEGQNACLLPDGSVWLFSIAELTIKRRSYSQLTATDITERWKLTEELQSRNAELALRREELTETLDNLQALSHERETQRARMRAHDILGERLTLLLRTIRGEAPPYALLRSLTAGLMDELKSSPAQSPQDDMDILKQTFEAIGVEILFDGELPGDDEKGKLFIDISKEAVTNAVRHGLATRVYITIGTAQGRRRMRITDNGQPPAGTIKEGGGISGMRSRLAAFGGALSVTAPPNYTLTIDVPEDEMGGLIRGIRSTN